MRDHLLRGKKLFLFDLDGVFFKGKESRVTIGGTAVVEAIRDSGRRLLVLTNNSTDALETIHERLEESGIPIMRDEILSSARLTAEYLKRRAGSAAYHLVGEQGFEDEMTRAGHVRRDGEGAQFVVVGLDRRLTYDKLNRAARVAAGGASIVAAHAARTYMYTDGPAVAVGPIVRAIEYASRKRAVAVGKPSPLMFELALAKAGCRKSEAVMIGDQVDTDLVGAARAKIDAILVTSGVDKDPRGSPVIATLSNVDEVADMM